MKRIIIFLLLILPLNYIAWGQSNKPESGLVKALPVKGHEKQRNGVLFQMEQGLMRVKILTPSIVRVTYTPTDNLDKYPKFAVINKKWEHSSWDILETDESFEISTDSLKVNINKKTGSLSYYNYRGKLVLSEPQGGSKIMVPAKVQGKKTYHATQEFNFRPHEGLYGLGQYQKKLMNYSGHSIRMLNTNKNSVVPFLVSSKGYGILWNNSSGSWFHDSFQKAFWSNVAHQIDYYFVYGPQIQNVVSGYRELTGKAPMYPKWAYGYFQSKERYVNQEEVLDVVDRYRKEQIPLDVIVQDWHYWSSKGWNSLTFNEKRYPNAKQMIDTLHKKYKAHFMLSVWPSFGVDTDIYNAMDSHGYLYPENTDFPPNQETKVYDAFNIKARKLYWKWIDKGLFSKGVDAWWLDSTEPSGDASFYSGNRTIHFNNNTYIWPRYLNAYSLMTTKGLYNEQRNTMPHKRVFILTRSAFGGQQRNAAAPWSGDVQASWNTLKKQIAAGLNISIAGIPYWTTDIGGFFVNENIFPGGSKNKSYRRLFVRWFQYGAFCPLFRVHGTDTPREIWQFGKPGQWAYDALVKADRLRYRLLPYIYSLAWKVTNNNSTIMRPLVYDFQHDSKVYNIWNQFMFGSSILVNPITEPHVTSRKVYLPKGTGWTNFWSGKSFNGGQEISAPAPISHIPLFVRDGAIIPMGPMLQYANQKPTDPLELRIYSGDDGHFTLYEDENDTYNYEQGKYATIKFNWDNASQTLTIGSRKGVFPGMLKKRTFHIVLVTKQHGTGLSLAEDPEKKVTYNGQRLSVKF